MRNRYRIFLWSMFLLSAASAETPTDADIERVLKAAEHVEYLNSRIAGRKTTIAQTEAFIDTRERELELSQASSAANKHGVISGLAMQLFWAYARLEGDRLKLWQAERLVEMQKTMPLTQNPARPVRT